MALLSSIVVEREGTPLILRHTAPEQRLISSQAYLLGGFATLISASTNISAASLGKIRDSMLFQGFAPATDLDFIRDRVAGIILGIVVTSVIFRYLWPEPEPEPVTSLQSR